LRLLPPHEAWVQYAWLVYLPGVFIEPIATHASTGTWAITIAGALVFLALYFRAHWVPASRIGWYIAAITALGVLYAPITNGALVYFIFASGFLGRVRRVQLGVQLLLAILAIAVLVGWLAHLGPNFWIPCLVFTALVGGINIHFGQVGRANARLRLAQDEITRLAQVAERERIARDLHDLLGHTLSVIVLKSELASRLAERDPARAIQEIREVEAISREALGEVRAAVTGYRAGGLSGELNRLADALRSAGLEVETVTEPVPLSAAEEGVLAMAVREAVTNVLRHAQARHCRIQVGRSNGGCRLEVKDDGRGGGHLREGAGLSGMRERVEAIGGRIERDGSSGMRLAIEIPLTTEQAS
jgi:two-component system sensor histidine kinase DesK